MSCSIQIFKNLAFTLILEAALTVKKSPQLFITNQDVHNVTSDSEVNYMFRQSTRYSFRKNNHQHQFSFIFNKLLKKLIKETYYKIEEFMEDLFSTNDQKN